MAVNSLAPGRFQINFRSLIFKLTFVNGGWGISYEISLRWMPLDLTDDKSTLVHVMAWCRQATSHYLSQCWPRSMSPNGVTRPQWVNISVQSSHSVSLQWHHMSIMAFQITGKVMFVQQLVHADIQENTTSPLYSFVVRNPQVTSDGFPSQRASNVESISMSWHHHVPDQGSFCECAQPMRDDVTLLNKLWFGIIVYQIHTYKIHIHNEITEKSLI